MKILDVLDKQILSTGELAAVCHVTKHTIIAAIERGELSASSTPGGHNRIRRTDALEFMRRHNLLPAEMNKKILVVDDEGFVRDIMQEIFEEEGYQIFHASNGYETGKLAERIRPDLILLDIMLPDIDGRDVCRHIREEQFGKNCTILAVTALKDSDEIRKIYSAGIDDYIAKPFGIDQLKDKVERLLAVNSV